MVNYRILYPWSVTHDHRPEDVDQTPASALVGAVCNPHGPKFIAKLFV